MRIDGQDALQIVPGTSLGLARLREAPGKDVAMSFSALPPGVRAYARRPELLVITKSTSRSTVHRPGYLEYVAVKRFDDSGNVRDESEWWEITRRSDARLDATYRRRVTVRSPDGASPLSCANAPSWTFDDAYVVEGHREDEHWRLLEVAGFEDLLGLLGVVRPDAGQEVGL